MNFAVDFIARIHEKFFPENPILGHIVIVGIGVVLFGMLFFFLSGWGADRYRERLSERAKSATPLVAAPSNQNQSEPVPRFAIHPPQQTPSPRPASPSGPPPEHQKNLPQDTSRSQVFSKEELIVLTDALRTGRTGELSLVTVGGTQAAAVSSQLRKAFEDAGWSVASNTIGLLNITVAGGAGGGKIGFEGLYLVTSNAGDPSVQTIVLAFQQAGHSLSAGSPLLEPYGEITLYVIYENRFP